MQDVLSLEETKILLGMEGEEARLTLIAQKQEAAMKIYLQKALEDATNSYKRWKSKVLYEQALDYASK